MSNLRLNFADTYVKTWNNETKRRNKQWFRQTPVFPKSSTNQKQVIIILHIVQLQAGNFEVKQVPWPIDKLQLKSENTFLGHWTIN